MIWKYLEQPNYNLLYEYARSLSGERAEYRYSADEDIRNKECFYIFWFVFRYVLECKTLGEALNHANKETLVKYKMFSMLSHRYMFVGHGEYKMPFSKAEDVVAILEILYNRYTFFEQMECFIRNATISDGYGCRQRRCEERMEALKRKVAEYDSQQDNYSIDYNNDDIELPD